jgi:hypothetical protein
MLSRLSLFGRTTIEPKLITMIYGTDTPPTDCAYGSPPPDVFARDERVTDTFKAHLAHTGQSRLRIKRPFYELDDTIAAQVLAVTVAALTAYINASNASRGTA